MQGRAVFAFLVVYVEDKLLDQKPDDMSWTRPASSSSSPLLCSP
jgi:hypothetical protein